MRIGVDVGGTNTDAVILEQGNVISWFKSPTTKDVYSGIVSAITTAMTSKGIHASDIDSIMIGTTQFTNAVIERRSLLPVGIVRLALPAASAIAPMSDWPEDLTQAIGNQCYEIRGGYEFDGSEIAPLDEIALAEAAKKMRKCGITSVAISSVFAPINGAMEQRAAEIIQNEIPGVAVSLSGELGQFGLLPRENSTIINASLAKLAKDVVSAFSRAIKDLGLNVPLYISQNDGTLMRPDIVEKYPVFTFASGPTNSMRGAAYLAKIEDAMVVDIGGTTSDVGMLRRGFPRQSTHFVDVGGVKTNFRMPDILAVGLGGGSMVKNEGSAVGPESVGYELTEKALCFGGETLTATDIAVAGGWANVGDIQLVTHLSEQTIKAARGAMIKHIDGAVEKMKTEARDLPLLVVGGGSILVDWPVSSVSEVIHPPFASVANAVGATIAQVSGEYEQVVSITPQNREEVLERAHQIACDHATTAGATASSTSIIEVELIPISYLPGNPTRLRVKAVGNLPI